MMDDATAIYCKAMRNADGIIADTMDVRRFIQETKDSDEWTEEEVVWFHEKVRRIRANARSLQTLLPPLEVM